MMIYFQGVWTSFCRMLGNQDSLLCYLLPLIRVVKPSYLPNAYGVKVVQVSMQHRQGVHLRLKVSRRWPGFVAGQHIELIVNDGGRNIKRTFSLCSSLEQWQRQGEIELFCRVNSDGRFTPLLKQLKVGDKLNIGQAVGEFVWQDDKQTSTFIAAGSGITPIAAMLLSQRQWPCAVTLAYRVKDHLQAPLLAELQVLAQQQAMFSLVVSESNKESASDFITQLNTLPLTKHYYLCGPTDFMQMARENLLSVGVDSKQIHQEQFGSAGLKPHMNEEADEQIMTTFLQAGVPKNVVISKSLSLLQGAEENGLTPNFGCRMGVCFQCVCQKVSGQVRDIRNGLLSGNGEEQIQLCVSQPISELVIKL
jgi:stearoyl-CoA 9-desaturase NADPH oxidoreductase